MLIFLYGDDSFRSRRKLNDLIAEYRIKHPSGLNFIKIADFDIDKLKMTVAVNPMFQEKKLIIIENVFQQKADTELLDYLSQKDLENDKDIILIIWENKKIEGKNELFGRLAKKPNLFEEFTPLSGAHLLNWTKKEIEKRGGIISNEVLKKLVSLTGGNLWMADNEINKLIAFTGGNEIKAEDIDLFVKGKIENNIFQTIDAIGDLNKKKAIALIQKYLNEGEDEFYLLSMIAYQFRNLLSIKDGLERGLSAEIIIKKTGLHPFVFKKSLAQTKNFTLRQLRNIYERLLKIDVSAKTGKIEPRLALEILIAEI